MTEIQYSSLSCTLTTLCRESSWNGMEAFRLQYCYNKCNTMLHAVFSFTWTPGLCSGNPGTSGHHTYRIRAAEASRQTIALWLRRVCLARQQAAWRSWLRHSPLFSCCLYRWNEKSLALVNNVHNRFSQGCFYKQSTDRTFQISTLHVEIFFCVCVWCSHSGAKWESKNLSVIRNAPAHLTMNRLNLMFFFF